MSDYGSSFAISIYGESHGAGVGVIVKGFPAGIVFDQAFVQSELDRRRPGQSKVTTGRKEPDRVQAISGIVDGKTTDSPINMFIPNINFDSSKYDAIKDLFRPGHADYTYHIKYGFRDHRGGGFSSGRLTAGMVAAGALAKMILKNHGIRIIGYTKSIGDIDSVNFDYSQIENNPVRCPDTEAAKAMEKKILEVKADGDSIGGLIEVVVKNVPKGLGEPRFGNLKGELSKAFHAIGAVTAIEFGVGCDAKHMLGSEFNDQMYSEGGQIKFLSNNSGGIQGGITNGEDIVVRLAIRPTPSIYKEQRTVDIHGENRNIRVEGDHDPCLCPRIVPVAEAIAAIVLADKILEM
jgi:chorismate synthase